MSQGWTVAELYDMAISTQADLGESKLTDLMFDLTDYVGFREIFNKEKDLISGGSSLEFNLNLSTNGRAHSMKIGEPTTFAMSDSLDKGTVPWKHMTTNYAIWRIRANMNKGRRQLVNEYAVERARAKGDLVKLAETLMWQHPTDGSDDWYGIPYWIVRWPTGTTTPGFTGTVPNGFTTVAGKTCTGTTAAYTNWAGQYLLATKEDLIKKMKRMATKTSFKAPLTAGADYSKGGTRRAYYCGIDRYEDFDLLAEKQNDKLGVDLDPMAGMPRFRRAPIIHVPALDDVTAGAAGAGYPVYQIDWADMGIKFLEGEDMVETTVKPGNDARCVGTIIDCTCQTFNAKRRTCGVLSTTSKTDTSS